MADHTPTTLMPIEAKKGAGAVKGLNDVNLNNRAFILATAFVFFVT